MFLASSNGLSIPRLGLVIAKKNIKHAVQRNRIKRLVREAFRHFQHELPAIDCVFLTRRGLDQLDNETITKQLMQQLKRLAKKAKETSPSWNGYWLDSSRSTDLFWALGWAINVASTQPAHTTQKKQ